MGGVGVAQAQTASGDVIHQANAGEGFSADGESWSPLTDYKVAGGDQTSSHGQPSSIDGSVPSGTPTQIWETERWDQDGGEEMQYEFDVPDGQQVEVRLYFYDGYSGTSSVGDRVFDVSVEGQTVLDDFDIIEKYGDDTGAMESFTVTSDGTIDVDFAHVTENPQINAIEIASTEASPDELGASTSSVDFGTVVTGDSQTETVTLTNLGNASNDSHPDITVNDVSISGTDSGQFDDDFSGSVTLAPDDSATVDVTYSPSEAQAHAATMEVNHSGTNSPVAVDLAGEGASDVPVGFSKSKLDGFSASSPTAIDFGPDGRAYVSTQGGTVYALDVERTGEDSYQVVNEVQIDAIKDIPNHDDLGNIDTGENTRQITGLTVGGTADQPVVYVGSSDPEIDVGTDDDDTDTNSGAISRLTINPGSDGTLQASEVDHDVMVLGLPRSEENHATNGLDLTPDGDTLYVAQGGHTNKGAPGDNFGHTPEYALSAAVLEIDLAQIETDHQAKNLTNYDGTYPNLDFYYGIPTIQNDDGTDGDDLPFGGNDGINQAKLIEGSPVQIYSPGYRNPYDLVLAESGQLYVSDHGPNGGWGGQPADANGDIVADAANVTNHPNEDGSQGTNDQLIAADEGEYGGHAAPIRANPTQADIYDADGNVIFDINESNSPVPSSMVNPVEADYIPPTSQSPDPGAPAGSANSMVDGNGNPVLFGPTGGTVEYTASNFGGAMEGDILQVELGGDVERVELSADGQTATNVETIFNTGGPLGITAQDDDEAFNGTVWTANHGGNDITVFEPNDYGDAGDGEQCTGADDPSLDEDGDGYDNADEIDAGTDPCSSSSTPADFDDDGESNLNDPDDDNDGIDDTEDLFAVDPNNGVDNELPATYSFAPNSESGTILDLGFTGVMMNGSNYQDLYDPSEVTAGGAANVLTVEDVGQGDAVEGTNTQEHGYQVGVNADEPFTVESTVNGLPIDAESFQSQGVFVGTGDQENYVKLTAAGFSDGSGSGVQLATEDGGSFTDVANPSAPTAGNETTLSMTVYPSNGTVEAYYAVGDGEEQFVDETTVPTEWFDTADGNGTAVGVISTSNGASSTFDATWQYLDVEPLQDDSPSVTADAGADQTVDEGDSVTLDATGSTGDGLSYEWTQTAGPDATLDDASSATPTFTAPDVDSETALTFEVEVSDGNATDTDEVTVTVQDTDVAAGEVAFAVNSGGSQYTATDGTVYQADTNFDGGNAYSTSSWASSPPEINDTDDDPLYRTERYGQNFSYDVPLENGTYEVTLKFAEIYQGVAPSDSPDSSGPEDGTNENDRVFDVTVEDQEVIENKDLYAEVGPLNATDETYTVDVTDGELNVAFPWDSDNYDNAKISAIKVVAAEEQPEEMTVAEAIAMGGEDDSLIEDSEIQQAINYWATDSEVPDTGGETISDSQIQQLINYWATDTAVGDGNEQPTASFTVTPDAPEAGQQVSFDASGSSDADGSIASYEWDFDGDGTVDATGEQVTNTFDAAGDYDVALTVTDDDDATESTTETVTVNESTADPGAASVSVTPDSGTEASTYGGGSFTVENTGGQQISSVTFDLSSSAMPDMVFDPDGTAGDQAAKGLNIDSQSSDGVGVVSTADGDVFSQPHNGVNGSDGYDVLTIEFTDFDPGESVSFSADNDPTSIKNASLASQEAGPVSGLELARSNVSVAYADGSAQETQLFGDGSAGGAQATLDESVAPAPSIDVQNVSLDASALRAHHSAATVSEAGQTVTVTGEPGETVTLLHFEAELELDNVPEYDGTPGYDIEAYEANKIENADYQTVTLDSNGEAEVPVTLLNTTDVGGYNHFVATHGEPGSDTGLDSNAVVLKYEASTDGGGDDGDATNFTVNAGGDAYTAADGTEFQADTNFDGGTAFTSGGSGTPAEPEIANTDDDELFWTERYGNFSYDVALEDGEYEVTLHFAELYQGVANDGGEGDRLFDVSIEGQQVLDSYDIYAEAGGEHAAINETFTAEVTDGELNVEFTTVENNAKVSAIEVEPVEDDENQPPTADAGADQTVEEGDEVTLDASNSSDPDDDSLSYDWMQPAGPDVTLNDTASVTPTFTAPEVDANETLTFEVNVSDGSAFDTDTVNVTVQDTEPANTAPTIEAIENRTVTEGDTATVNVSASDDDDDSLTLSVDGPDFVSLTDEGDGNGTIDIAPQSGDADTYTVNVTADDGTATTTESFQLTVESPSAGDGLVYAVNAGGSNYTAADGTDYVNDTKFDGSFSDSAGTTVDTSLTIENTQDDPLYQTERYSDPLSYSMPVEDGTYEVTLQFAEIWHGEGLGGNGDDDGGGDGEVGDRVFNASIEGEQVLTDYDIYADVGALNATEKTFTVEVTDGELNVELDASVDNGKLSAFTVSETDSSGGGDSNTAPTIDAVANQTVTEGNSTTVSVTADDPDGDNVSLSVSGPDFVTLSNGDLTIAPEPGDAGTYTVDVTADDGNGGTATESFQVTVEEAASSPQVLHRVNAGETETLEATDDGPNWTGVADASSQYLVSVADSNAGTYGTGDDVTPTGSVPDSTPDAVFDWERYGEMQWEFDVSDGEEVEVRLYLGNQYPDTDEPGNRTYNVSVEGDQVLTNYDPVADVGHANGTMKSFTVTSDGTLDIDFEEGAADNPQVNAIEIVESEESNSQ